MSVTPRKNPYPWFGCSVPAVVSLMLAVAILGGCDRPGPVVTPGATCATPGQTGSSLSSPYACVRESTTSRWRQISPTVTPKPRSTKTSKPKAKLPPKPRVNNKPCC